MKLTELENITPSCRLLLRYNHHTPAGVSESSSPETLDTEPQRRMAKTCAAVVVRYLVITGMNSDGSGR